MAQDRDIILADIDEWHSFARDNAEALHDAYGSISAAYQHAIQGGLTLGGGASPMFTIRFAD